MKRQIILIFTVFVFSIPSLFSQIKMNSSGNVVIGGSNPSSSYDLLVGHGPYENALRTYGWIYFSTYYYGMYIDGSDNYDLEMYPAVNNYCRLGRSNKGFRDIYTYNLHELSDSRQKENIKEIPNALNLVLQLHGIQYDLKKEYAYQDSLPLTTEMIDRLEAERKGQYGFIAQDVAKIIPEVISYDDSTDVYSIRYTRVVPLLTNAIREQQAQIELLQTEIEDLKTGGLKSLSTVLPKDSEVPGDGGESVLYQNKPNPFNEITRIAYLLPDHVANVNLYIYNMNGKQLRNIELQQRGHGDVTIQGGELEAGMYM